MSKYCELFPDAIPFFMEPLASETNRDIAKQNIERAMARCEAAKARAMIRVMRDMERYKSAYGPGKESFA